MITLSPTRMGAAAQVAALVLLVAAPLAATPADARAGGGFSFGSRGSRSFSMPSATTTAPRAAPFQQSDAPRMRPGMSPQPSRFGFGSGLLAGLFGAGLFGMFSGAGFFGGIAALFGLMFKLAIIGGIVWLLLRVFRGRTGPAMASGPSMFSGRPASGAGPAPGASSVRSEPLTIEATDFQAFERTLGAIQEAYSREDIGTLSRLSTPEMVRHLGTDIAENQRRGLRNDVSQVKLLQGDLSESWIEGGVAYATVAMRFGAIDVMVDRGSGRIASGDPVHPVEAVEFWTFRRDGRAAPWILSGIQQAA